MASAIADGSAAALAGWKPTAEVRVPTARTQTRRAADYLRDAGAYRERREIVDALAGDSSLADRS